MSNKIFFLLVCISCLFLCSCYSKNTYFLMTENRKNPSSIDLDSELTTFIEKNHAKIFLDFDNRYQKNKQGVGFKIFAKENFEKLIIDDITIKFFNHSEHQFINKTYQRNLVKKTLHPTQDIDYEVFYAYESYMYSKFFIDFDKLFKNLELEKDSSFPLLIVVNYKLDDKFFSQELSFIVSVTEKRELAPRFIYKYLKGF